MSKRPKFPKHWLTRFYNANASQIDSCEIHDKFRWEAAEIAETKAGEIRADDWNLVEIKH